MATRSDVLRLRVDLDSKTAERDMSRFTGTVERENRRIQGSTDRTAKGFRSAQVSLRGFLGVAAGITGAAFTIDRLAQKADSVSNLSTAFQTLSGRIGAQASRFLPELRTATRGLVTDLELMRLSNNAVILGVAESQEQFARLAEGATRLGRAVGLDATQSIESLVTGIGRQSRQMLDNLGIIVRAEEAYERFAAKVGKSAEQLSDAERKTAFATAAIEAMDKALVGVNAETGRFSDLWNQAKVSVVNAVNEILDEINRLPTTGIAGLGNLAFRAVPGASVPFGIQGEIERFQRQQSAAEFERMFQERVFGDIPDHLLQPAAEDVSHLLNRVVAMAVEPLIGRTQPPPLELLGRVIDPLSAEGQRLIGDAPAFGEAFPATLEPQLTEAEEATARFGERFEQIVGTEMAFAAAELGGALVDAALSGDIAFGKFMKNLIRDLLTAIAKALILEAILGGATGGKTVLAQGGVIRPTKAQSGVLVRGGVPGVDSVPFATPGGPILAQRGEAITVLPKALTEFLTEAGRAVQQQAHNPLPVTSQSPGQGAQANATRSASTIVVVNAADLDLRERLEDNPEAVVKALRRANVLRT